MILPLLILGGSSFFLDAGMLGEALADSAVCNALSAGEVQQDCLTLAGLPKPDRESSSGSGSGADVMAPLSPDAFRAVTRDDLVAKPDDVLRKPIALSSTRCFSFGISDIRCMARGVVPIAVAAAVILPPGAEVAVEQGCTPGTPGSPRGCLLRIMFVPVSYEKAQLEGRDAIVLRTASVMIASKDPALPAPSAKP